MRLKRNLEADVTSYVSGVVRIEIVVQNRRIFKHMVLCNQRVANYFPENETIAIRKWLIISQRTRPVQSEGGLLFPRERDHCNQMVVNYFPEYGSFLNMRCFAVRR